MAMLESLLGDFVSTRERQCVEQSGKAEGLPVGVGLFAVNYLWRN